MDILRRELSVLHKKYEDSSKICGPIGSKLDDIRNAYYNEKDEIKKIEIEKQFYELRDAWEKQYSIQSTIGKQIDIINNDLSIIIKQKHGKNPIYLVKTNRFLNNHYFSNEEFATNFLKSRRLKEPHYKWNISIVDAEYLNNIDWVLIDS